MLILKYIGTLTTLAIQAVLFTRGHVVEKPIMHPFVCPCEYTFQPVCGSDGVTYHNMCILECYNAAAKEGTPPVTVCTDDIICTECVCLPIHLPVCAQNGYTYFNECELSCENMKRLKDNKSVVYLAYRAACFGPPCSCTNIAAPMCGSNKILYRNRCELDCANVNSIARGLSSIEFKNVGACVDGCQCPNTDLPVCGSDGVEYRNLCEIACQNKKKTYSTSMPITPAPEHVCFPTVPTIDS